MDLGFGGFLEKFEDHFGRLATKVLLVIIGATIVSVCAVTIWTLFLRPVAVALADVLPQPTSLKQAASRAAKLIFFAVYFIFIVNVLLSIADTYLKRRDTRRLKEKVAEARRLKDEAQEKLAEAEAVHKRTDDNLAAAHLVLERIFATALEHELLDASQVEEFKALLGDFSNAPEA